MLPQQKRRQTMRTLAQKQTQPQKAVSSSVAPSKIVTPGSVFCEHPILHLQHVIGNQAVQRLLQTHDEELKAGWTASTLPPFGYDFSRIPIHPPTEAAIQTKLAINQPGDEHEQEEDHLVDQVMRMPEPQLQRACLCSEGCPKCQTEQMAHKQERMHTMHVGTSDSGQTAAPPIVHEVLASPGQPLDSAREVNASAYTVGRHVVFASGKYAPLTPDGKRLLAHELVHTVQQGNAGVGMLARAPRTVAEIEAEIQAVKKQPQMFASQPVAGSVPGIAHEVLHSPVPSLDASSRALSEPRVAYDFSQVSVHSDDHLLKRKPIDHSLPNVPRPLIQTKLTVGSSRDPFEQEADRVADQVMAAPSHSLVSDSPPQIQRSAGDSSADGLAAPASVDRVLASPGSPLEPALRQDMEQRFGHDFSQVRVHTDSPAAQSARDVNANAYTKGSAVVFGAGRFAPAASEGRRLLAHELTHVVQQSGGDKGSASIPIQREVAQYGEFLAPDALVDKFKDAMNQKFFGKLARVLVDAVYSHPTPYQYISEVFEKVHDWDSDLEDNLGAEFVSQLPKSKLDQMANAYDGRQTLTVVYEAIITGDVSPFEREQANKVLMAKARAYRPEDYLRQTRIRQGGKRTRIFPIRFMRVTPGYDYATPLAELMPNGTIRVKYPVAVQVMDTFKAEVATLEGGFFVGKGEEINPNEIVGIKDYERGGGVQYLPAMALIDYSNQAVRSTAGKILEVSIFAATMGIGAGAAAGGGVAATEVRMTAIWAARLTRAASVLDRVANAIGIASFVINENRDWIIRKLGKRGEQLVQIAEAANSIAGIYGIARLGQLGYKIVKEMQSASKAVRMEARVVTQEENVVLKRLDDETDSLLKQLDAEAAKTGPSQNVAPVEKPTAGSKVDTKIGKAGADRPTNTGPVGSQSRTGYSRKPPRREEDIALVAGGTKRRVGPVDRGKGPRPRYANDPVAPKVKGAPKTKVAFETDFTKIDLTTLDQAKLKHLGPPTPERPWHGRLEGLPEGDPRLKGTSGGKDITDFDAVENGILLERKTAVNAGDPKEWAQKQITEKYENLRQLRAEKAREYPEYKDADIGFRFEGGAPTQEFMDAVYDAIDALEKKYGTNIPVEIF